MEGELRALKERLRNEMRLARRATPPEQREVLSKKVAEQVLSLPELASPSRVAGYLAFGSEVQTRHLLEEMAERGHELYLPFVEGSEMQVARWEPGDPLVQSSYGPKEPSLRKATDPARLDLVLVPGLAFDRCGRRLGWGGGFYDRFLERAAGVTSVGLGFHSQLIEAVPVGPTDRRLAVVVTDLEVVRCRESCN
jgi:5-formyltetrahydrofolate cyclo-ligase